ncbi:TauD/TfdA dioxygenase family protein [Rhodococcus artemisiae]|uniref:TauD/TfdA family dioxygenase n=1 Tax=Rhodococcus artemisiae TaxID=714159 RepID=A0ABU7LFP6_9NOCA|nr:TauD/TfdA family dioxygenase [Rhodococcus artemisiae]MEE2060377.1 TauD/TfdA family dioxygenase [Rhodococcus artemisiae]
MFPDITPISEEIGAEITGVAGHTLNDPKAAARCQELVDRYGVVVFREAKISDSDLVELSRMLGEVVVPPMGGQEDHPEVSAISLDPAKTVLAAYNTGTFHWHIDGATDEVPQKGTLLTALQVSDEGGDTEFANTYASYEALSDQDKAEFETLRVVHSFATAQRLANPEPTEKQEAAWARVPEREHPLVWTRRSGRKSLLIGATASHVVGWPEEQGKGLIGRLLAWSTQPRFSLRHHWQPGDLVLWDNTGMLHRAVPYSATSPRLLHRTTLVGEEAVA